jgi:hypothetical protein
MRERFTRRRKKSCGRYGNRWMRRSQTTMGVVWIPGLIFSTRASHDRKERKIEQDKGKIGN